MDILQHILSHITNHYAITDDVNPLNCRQFILPRPPKPSTANELLIHSHQDETSLGVSFSTKIHDLLDKGNVKLDTPTTELAVIIEELSHLVYGIYHFSQGRQLSRLEFEVQGEIDRFLFLHHFTNPSGDRHRTEDLFQFLFSSVEFHEFINSQESLLSRYSEAHRLGKKACRVISVAAAKGSYAVQGLTQRLFRQHGHEKLHIIETLKAA